MKKCILALGMSVLFSLVAAAQTPNPTATPTADNDVVKISTTLVQVDITVVDNKGKVVTDLKPNEIEIYQNGKKQDITNFSFIPKKVETTEVAGQKQKTTPTTAPLGPVGPIKPQNIRRTLAIVVDDLNLSFQSMAYVQAALRKFVNEQMREGDLISILRTGAAIGALQQFTNDKRQLLAEIDQIRYNGLGTGSAGPFAALEATTELEQSLPFASSSNDVNQDPGDTSTNGCAEYPVRDSSVVVQ